MKLALVCNLSVGCFEIIELKLVPYFFVVLSRDSFGLCRAIILAFILVSGLGNTIGEEG